jgi:endonuclease/exonuclease/phosphatase family metal-dependent hydrolase
MKLATWNLERGGKTQAAREAQEELLAELRADVVVLTEPASSYKTTSGVVTSPRLRKNGTAEPEAWVAIVGSSVEPVDFDVPYKHTAVAARASVGGLIVIIYGAVLPWLAVTSHADELVEEGEDSFAVFKRVLAEQAKDIADLRKRYGSPVIWAGDFNQTVSGPNWGGSNDRRDLLIETINSLELEPWNGKADHAMNGMCAVDLICGPKECFVLPQGRIDPVRGKLAMSDHAGYWVELTARQ